MFAFPKRIITLFVARSMFIVVLLFVTLDPRYSEERPKLITIPKVDIEFKVWCKAEHSNILTLHVELCNLGTAKAVQLDFKDNPLVSCLSYLTSLSSCTISHCMLEMDTSIPVLQEFV